jgi:hypothetical protein
MNKLHQQSQENTNPTSISWLGDGPDDKAQSVEQDLQQYSGGVENTAFSSSIFPGYNDNLHNLYSDDLAFTYTRNGHNKKLYRPPQVTRVLCEPRTPANVPQIIGEVDATLNFDNQFVEDPSLSMPFQAYNNSIGRLERDVAKLEVGLANVNGILAGLECE